MEGPRSAPLRAAGFLVVLIIYVALLLWPAAAGEQKNPRPFAGRGLLSKSGSPSTSRGGIADYDDQQHNLPNN
jgi:hypothetical protein